MIFNVLRNTGAHLILARLHVHPHAGGVEAAVAASPSFLGGQAVVETKSQHFRSIRKEDRPVRLLLLRVQLHVLLVDDLVLDEDLHELGLDSQQLLLTPRKTRLACPSSCKAVCSKEHQSKACSEHVAA